MNSFLRFVPALCGLALAQAACAQSTTFTYQGELTSGTAAANGIYDLRFRLYDALSGGTQIGTTQCIDNLSISAGVFSVPLDFGQQFISTAPRYIEIEVRPDTGFSCGNTSGYTVLAPRQALTPAPRATAATTANSLSIPNGSSVLVNLTNTGLVGVGTSAPTSQFHLNGVQDAMKITATQPFITLTDTSSAGSPRVQLQNSLGRYFVTSESFMNGTNSGGFTMVDPQGRLGLGVFDPAMPLDVGGRFQVRGTAGQSGNSPGVVLSSPLAAPTPRAFVGLYDDTHVGFFGWAGASWGMMMSTVNGNVGIGTSTPAAKLQVNGNIMLGTVGQYSAAAGSEQLRIVRGGFWPDGTLIAGSGWTQAHLGTGHYQITFTTPFAGPPTVTCTCNGFCNLDPIFPTASTFHVYTMNHSGSPADLVLHFIAVGPR